MNSNWYEDMAEAVKKREKVTKAIAKWQAVLAEVELQIAELAQSGDRIYAMPAPVETQEPTQEPEPSV